MFSSAQLLELFVVLCTADHYRYAFSKIGDAAFRSRTQSGPIRPESMSTPLSIFITPLQALAYSFYPTLYVLCVVALGFHQPRWMHTIALPEVTMAAGLGKNTIRVLACFASVALQTASDSAFAHLGDQFHPIGRRERSRIVQTGQYAWVRHPLYVLSLIQVALWSLMFWSYAPLVMLGVTATILVVKINIEEEIILRDDAVKEEYRAYMRKVPAKLVPYLW